MPQERRHGEYKLPGGKLATVDLLISESGHWQQVRFRGDFFIHPDSATATVLQELGNVAEQIPTDLEPDAIAAHLAAAVPYPIELVGTTPLALARALWRAVHGEDGPEEPAQPPVRVGRYTPEEIASYLRSWVGLPWRILPEVRLPPAVNVALDEILTDQLAAGAMPPCLRFWCWSQPAVIIGRSQSLANEVDATAAANRGIQIVRRMTGGGAMFLQPHGAITYSLYLPEAMLAGHSIRASYELCESWLIQILRGLGVDAHHVPINDIACQAGKIGGAAQARRGGVVLHHTTLAYDMDPGEMVQVLRIGREKLKDKGTTSAAKRVSPLVTQTGLSREAIVQALLTGFESTYGGTQDQLKPEELAAADQLVQRKYGHPAWTAEFE